MLFRSGLISTDLIGARGREARVASIESPAVGFAQPGAPVRRVLKIGSNENAYGPGPAALDAARSVLGPTTGRYPANVPDLTASIARQFGVEPQNVLIGTGSGEVIEAAVKAFTSAKARPSVASLNLNTPFSPTHSV